MFNIGDRVRVISNRDDLFGQKGVIVSYTGEFLREPYFGVLLDQESDDARNWTLPASLLEFVNKPKDSTPLPLPG
jgi:hypothetical protein